MSKTQPVESPELATLLVYTSRERARAFVRAAFPKRKWKVVMVRDIAEFRDAFRTILIDAALVDVGSATAATSAGGEIPGSSMSSMSSMSVGADDSWKIASLAHEFPSAPFFGITPLRATDAPAIARCASLEMCDVLVDGLDESVARDLVAPRTFSARFVAALSDPPQSLGLKTEMQLATWRGILAGSGRPVRTAALAREVGVSREHLSRHFSAPGAPNLKRVIDLVRMIGAAELAKNPGLDVRDVAKILGFASSSHLAVTAQRVLGTRPASLSRLRTVDLIERFTQGRTRSRG
ncbi:MAG TPA: helix-turn-helix domain-containing protein [Gemmatimonadaceae bacterium]|nr:helix-turn-helix domain-containing protein [Gemmatimonadaceae bacterium]